MSVCVQAEKRPLVPVSNLVSLSAGERARANLEGPRQLMGYAGMVSSEHLSGEKVRRGSISKAGNAHLRRFVTEAAWNYRHVPAVGPTLAARQRAKARRQGHRLARAASSAWALPGTPGQKQDQTEGNHCRRA